MCLIFVVLRGHHRSCLGLQCSELTRTRVPVPWLLLVPPRDSRALPLCLRVSKFLLLIRRVVLLLLRRRNSPLSTCPIGPSQVFLSSRWPVAQPRCGCTKGCVCAIADGEDTVVERETGRGVSGCVGCEREQVWRPVCTRGGRCAWWKQARTMIIPVRCFTCGKVRCKMRGRKETQNKKRQNEN